jgi:hypothetical protein
MSAQHANLSAGADIATMLTAVCALLAIVFAIWQTRQFRAHQLEALARDQYQRFLELCIQYPEYADPPPGVVDMEKLTFSRNAKRFVQYEWFLTSGMNALEAVYAAVGRQKPWRETIKSVLEAHAPYLSSMRYDAYFRPTTNPVYQRFLDDTVVPRGS